MGLQMSIWYLYSWHDIYCCLFIIHECRVFTGGSDSLSGIEGCAGQY